MKKKVQVMANFSLNLIQQIMKTSKAEKLLKGLKVGFHGTKTLTIQKSYCKKSMKTLTLTVKELNYLNGMVKFNNSSF